MPVSAGATTRQMLNLWGTSYALGVQSNVLYLRTGGGLNVYQDGTHSDTQNSAGGGTTLMQLNSSSFSYKGSAVWHAGNFNPANYAALSGAAFTGTITIKPPFSSTQFASYLQMQPNDLAAGKTNFFINKDAGVRDWAIGMYDSGLGYAGDLNFLCGNLKHLGNKLWTDGNQTLSASANGYIKLPNGLIIQWGIIPTGSGADPAVTFPLAFPNACFSVQATSEFTDGTSTYAVHTSNVSTTGFTARRRRVQGMTWVGETSSATRWMAVGY